MPLEYRVSNTTPERLTVDEIVRAGAGAGKTYTLTHRVMDIADEMLRLEKRFPRVIVTTFTRKATQELRERLMLLALNEKPHLVDFVNSRSHLVVSTIHGIMDLYLKRYGANICVDPGYTVVSGQQATKLTRQILRQVLLQEGGASDLLETFPFNRLAQLVRKIDSVLAENPEAKPYDGDAIADLFVERANELSRELNDVADHINAESTKADWLEMAEAFKAFAKLLTSGDWKKNRSTLLAALEGTKTARRNAKNPPVSDETADRAEVLRKKLKELNEPIFDPEVWVHFVDRFDLIARIAQNFSEEFRKQKRERGWLELSDLELQAMNCIRNHPNTAQAFSEEWDFWLIDEYQDTSPFQVELLRKLIGGQPSFIVGDPQQSIYLFRGARSEVFGQKEVEIETRGGKQRLLTMNRRSAPELLLFLNDLFGRMRPPFRPMDPFLPEGKTIDRSKLVATIYPAAPDREIELQSLVAHTQNLLAEGAKLEDICVLGRTNAVLQDVAERLALAGLPTHVHAASGFFDRRETRDAIALLKFLVNPHDGLNLIELLRTPWFKIPDRTLVEIAVGKPESLWERLIAERSMSDEMQAVSRLERLLELAEKESLSGAFRTGLLDSGFVDLSLAHDASGRRESNVWKLLSRLEMEECRSGFNPLSFVNGQVLEAKTDDGNAEGDAIAAVEPARINLMTVHASKGLEFRHVIVPRMEQRPRLTYAEEFIYDPEVQRWAVRVPYGENADMTASLAEKIYLDRFRDQERAEHARVLYVALTRAIDSIYLSWSEQPETGSWADLLRLDLAPGVHEEKDYRYVVCDEPVVGRAVNSIEREKVSPRKPWSVPRSTQNALQIPEGHQAPKPMSVTEMLDRKPGVHLSSNQARDVSKRLKIAADGTAVHKLMELLKYPSRTLLGRLISKWFPGREDEVLQAVEFVRKCEAPPLLEIIENGAVEWGFSMLERGLLIEGQVDLWGRTHAGEAWIIDYKTGNPLGRDKAFAQMGLYSVALRKSGLIRDDEKIKLAAVYPFSEEIFVYDEPTREEVLAAFGA